MACSGGKLDPGVPAAAAAPTGVGCPGPAAFGRAGDALACRWLTLAPSFSLLAWGLSLPNAGACPAASVCGSLACEAAGVKRGVHYCTASVAGWTGLLNPWCHLACTVGIRHLSLVRYLSMSTAAEDSPQEARQALTRCCRRSVHQERRCHCCAWLLAQSTSRLCASVTFDVTNATTAKRVQAVETSDGCTLPSKH